jgi:hypothetical protein
MRHALLPLIATFAIIGMSIPVRADDDVAINQLPNPVVNAIQTQFPKAELLSAERDRDDGKTKYEVKIRTENGRKDVKVTPEGEILKVKNED